MNLRFFAIAAVGLLLLAADKPDDATKKELEKFQGTWSLQSRIFDGQEVKKENEKLTFDGSKVTISSAVAETWEILKLDPSSKPASIDLSVSLIVMKEKGTDKVTHTVKGIYKFDGETLKIALGRMERPEEFPSEPNPKVMLVVLKRDRK